MMVTFNFLSLKWIGQIAFSCLHKGLYQSVGIYNINGGVFCYKEKTQVYEKELCNYSTVIQPVIKINLKHV